MRFLIKQIRDHLLGKRGAEEVAKRAEAVMRDIERDDYGSGWYEGEMPYYVHGASVTPVFCSQCARVMGSEARRRTTHWASQAHDHPPPDTGKADTDTGQCNGHEDMAGAGAHLRARRAAASASPILSGE